MKKKAARPLGTCQGFDGRHDWLCYEPYNDGVRDAFKFVPLAAQDAEVLGTKPIEALWRRAVKQDNDTNSTSTNRMFLVCMHHPNGVCVYNSFTSAYAFLCAAKRIYGANLSATHQLFGPFVAYEHFALQSGPARLVLDLEFYPQEEANSRHIQPNDLRDDVVHVLRQAFLEFYGRVPVVVAAESHKPLKSPSPGPNTCYEKISFHIAVPFVSAEKVTDSARLQQMQTWTKEEWIEFREESDEAHRDGDFFGPAVFDSVHDVRCFVARLQAWLVSRGDTACLPNTGLSPTIFWSVDARESHAARQGGDQRSERDCSTNGRERVPNKTVPKYRSVLDTAIYPRNAGKLKSLRMACSGKQGDPNRRVRPLNVARCDGAAANALQRFTLTGFAPTRRPVYLSDRTAEMPWLDSSRATCARHVRRRDAQWPDERARQKRRRLEHAALDNADIVASVTALLKRHLPMLDCIECRSADNLAADRVRLTFDWTAKQPRPCGFEWRDGLVHTADKHTNNRNFFVCVDLCTLRVSFHCFSERCAKKRFCLGHLTHGCSKARSEQSVAMRSTEEIGHSPTATSNDDKQVVTVNNNKFGVGDFARYDLVVVASHWHAVLSQSRNVRIAAALRHLPRAKDALASVRRCAVALNVEKSDTMQHLRAVLPASVTLDVFDERIVFRAPRACRTLGQQKFATDETRADIMLTTRDAIAKPVAEPANVALANQHKQTRRFCAQYRVVVPNKHGLATDNKNFSKNTFAQRLASVLHDQLCLSVGTPVVQLLPLTECGRVGIVQTCNTVVSVDFGDAQPVEIKPSVFVLHNGAGTRSYAMTQYPLHPLTGGAVALEMIEQFFGRLRIAPTLSLRIGVPLDQFGWSAALLERVSQACDDKVVLMV